MRYLTLAPAVALGLALPAVAQNPIDGMRPDAPELAPYGARPVGVTTQSFTDPDRIDVVRATDDAAPTADRTITAEIWYPAAEGTEPGTDYTALMRDGATEVTLTGRAAREAQAAGGTFPLVVISHGYPGNRFLMSHLGENLASKGYVVASLDHPDSMYQDMGVFPSTLVNRPVDQAFMVDALTGWADHPVGAMIDDDAVGIVGYSMGGYGALIYAGGGLSQAAIERREPSWYNAPGELLARNAAGADAHAALADPAVKAVVAIGPWGRNRDFWDAAGLAGVAKPLMIVAGGVDDVSSYPAIRQIFEETTGTDRLLLTFENANHNAAAPMPAPEAAWQVSEATGEYHFDHYADAVWDNVRMNNILQHFVTAFMDLNLKGEAEKAEYLDLVELAADGVIDRAEDGTEGPDHSYWKGFADRSAHGLRLERRAAGK
ncbi:alpha/beta hydrolase family protein [Jannaschia ovalis]|uniref:Dienelactone hydrolase n=1 Tax=Jannaschia ovalis TaxID=3038773 RepID=A0ABY8LC33_9RHOB|nr:dienelactone hydrolase [Jannaschia sp. GRR-S6-38]WGH78877.1 dienelactone hydrolase [Jannaschia sp. GRR-S6-38]